MQEKFESQLGVKNEEALKHVRRFFEMTKAEEEDLRDKISKHKGLVRAFIHPNFGEYADFENIKTEARDIEKLKKEKRAFERLLSSKSKDVPPLFIFENGAKPKDFQEGESRLDVVAQSDVYVIRTELANPNPLSPDRESTYRHNFFEQIPDKEKKQMWDWVRDEFKQLGIKKIFMGGLELYAAEKGDEEQGGCLGAAISELKDSFEIEISALTWPDSGRKTKSNSNNN